MMEILNHWMIDRFAWLGSEGMDQLLAETARLARKYPDERIGVGFAPDCVRVEVGEYDEGYRASVRVAYRHRPV